MCPERTVITERPSSVHLEHNDTAASFRCTAVSDDSTPVTVSWLRVDSSGYETPVRNDSAGQVAVSTDGSQLSLTVPENVTNAWTKLRGQYRCRATNGYSHDVVDVTLSVGAPPAPIVTAVVPIGA